MHSVPQRRDTYHRSYRDAGKSAAVKVNFLFIRIICEILSFCFNYFSESRSATIISPTCPFMAKKRGYFWYKKQDKIELSKQEALVLQSGEDI